MPPHRDLWPFGDVAIPGGAAIALERALAAFSVHNEETNDAYWRIAQYTAEQIDDELLSGSRAWWRFFRKDEGWCWISLDPGEFRTVEPTPPDIVRDLPETSNFVSSRLILEAVVAACETEPFGAYHRTLLETAQYRLALGAGVEPAFPVALTETIRRAAELPREAFVDLIHTLYEDYLQGCRVTVDFVTPVIALLQLQAAFEAFLEQDWLADPRLFLPSFVAHIVNDPSRRASAIATAVDICNDEFASARADVQRFLTAKDLHRAPATLLLAYHRFQLVRMIVGAFVIAEYPLTGLAFTDILIEEAAVCAMSGLGLAAMYLPNPPTDYALKILSLVEHDPVPISVRKAARVKSTEIHPIHPRQFADIHGAHALTLCASDALVSQGIASLEALRDGLPIGARFEQGWIDLALLAAYQKRGDAERVSATATRFATSMVISRYI